MLSKGIETFSMRRWRRKSIIYWVRKLSEYRSKGEIVAHADTRDLESSCTCGLFENNGTLCKHIFQVMLNNMLHILLHRYILNCWTIHSRHRNIGIGDILMGRSKIGNEKQINLLKYWALQAKFDNVLDMLFKCLNSAAPMQNLDYILSNFMQKTRKQLNAIKFRG